MSVRVLHGDCMDILPTLEAESVHAVVTDPPYELGFMGKSWDKSGVAFRPETWRQVLRVLKPGGYMVAFGAPRNSHRLTCAIEDAGFEIRDSIARLHDGGLEGPLLWCFGSGFPKSLDVSKAIDKAAGAVREVISARAAVKRMIPGADQHATGTWIKDNGRLYTPTETAPATPEGAAWAGWGTALKPAYEPIILARKPLQGTVAGNVLKHGCGGLNIDACRVEAADGQNRARPPRTPNEILGGGRGTNLTSSPHNDTGRWPSNLIHDNSPEVLDAFGTFGDKSSPWIGNAKGVGAKGGQMFGGAIQRDIEKPEYVDSGTAARFFPACPWSEDELRFHYSGKATAEDRAGSKHPTVKPLSLLNWLCSLICPPGGTILDPFAGSGTTLLAADRLQFNAIGIEQSAEYVADIHHRLRSDAPLFAEPVA